MTRAPARLLALLLLAAALSPLLVAAPAPDASLAREGKPPAPLRAEDRDGKTFLLVNDAVAALEGTITWDERTRSYEVKVKGRTAVFGADTPIAVVDTKIVNLSSPVRTSNLGAWAEPEFFVKVLGPLTGQTLAWDRATRTLSARKAELAEIAVEPSVAELGELTKVVLRFSQPPSYAVETTPDQVVLHFPLARLTGAPTEKLLDSPRVSRLLVRGSEVTVVFRQKGLAANVYALGSPPRLVVDVMQPPASAPAPVPAPAATRPAKTIVIDPGHGGTEEGARGPGGSLEKDATLALAKTVQDTLQRRGYRVVLTRTTDATVGLDDRAAAANAAKADVFLSLHFNASRAAAAHGTEVYYLSLDASDRAAAALAESENRAVTETPTAEKNAAVRDLDLILWDLAQNQHLAASARLAEIVQADFNRLLGIATRGVKQAPFRVLIGVNAPAVLVEVSFITNPDEEKKLTSEDFRRQVADTLAGSLETYFRTADGAAPVPYAPKAGKS
ncbi:MAG TPA: N-acetylmuramoyl-L-alanine amidase [Thermoanaerobaculia bacterium]|nr:N-acetylmuramoyl-L-alanine amidase [Thermoanaerobaculia bacterium]